MANNNNNRKFGVEFEFFITRKGLLKLFSMYPEQLRNDNDINQFIELIESDDYDNYTLNETFDYLIEYIMFNILKLDKGWSLHSDGSIVVPDANKDFSIEVVTPPLSGKEGLNQINKFLSVFGKVGKVNKTCGLHVHVDAPEFLVKDNDISNSAKRAVLALMRYGSLEKTFDSLVAANRRKNKNEFTRSVNVEKIIDRYKYFLVMRSQDDAFYSKLPRLINILTDNNDRYYKLNIISLLRHGTLEFRHMGGSLDFKTVSSWIKIVISFVDLVLSTEQQFENMFRDIDQVASEEANYIKNNISKIYHNFDGLNNNDIQKLFSSLNIRKLESFLKQNISAQSILYNLLDYSIMSNGPITKSYSSLTDAFVNDFLKSFKLYSVDKENIVFQLKINYKDFVDNYQKNIFDQNPSGWYDFIKSFYKRMHIYLKRDFSGYLLGSLAVNHSTILLKNITVIDNSSTLLSWFDTRNLLKAFVNNIYNPEIYKIFQKKDRPEDNRLKKNVVSTMDQANEMI